MTLLWNSAGKITD